jgi:hypothetical protein
MGAISSLAGGQSCWGGESVAGSDIGPGFDDNSAFILVQEMLHCLGLVDPASPNSDPTNTAHSKNFTIGLNLFGNLGSMIDFLDHTDHNPAYSLMFPSFFDGNANDNFLEGYEWNELHAKLLAMNPQNLFTTNLLDLDFLADRAGTGAALLYAGRSTSNGILPTVSPASSDYSLEFLDAPGSVIASQPVDVSFANSTHDDPNAPEVDTRNVNVHVPVPDGAVSWQLVHDGTPQLTGALSTQAPQISTLAGITDGTNHEIHLRWAASGAEFYRLFFQATPKTPQILVANGLTDSSFDALTDFLPPAPHGIFTLVASNGNLTTERTIKEPVTSQVSLSIIGPPAGTPVIAGTPTTFQAFATLGSEPLDNQKCKWEVHSVVVGKACTLTTLLTEGVHNVMVTVTSSHPHTKTSTTLPVSVGPPAA